MMLHDHVTSRGGTGDVTIKVLTPLSAPVPISKEVSNGVLDALESRGIEFWPETQIEALDPVRKVAILVGGREVSYDLFLAVPVHKAPDVVTASGLTEDGWIPVNTDNFSTRFPGVYAIGDVTSAPVPRAGVFAEGEAATLAQHLIAQFTGGKEPGPYRGAAVCYFEFGGGEVGSAEVSFLDGPKPTGRFRAPTPEIAAEKKAFAATRRARWFG